jgi:hypothetical protein
MLELLKWFAYLFVGVSLSFFFWCGILGLRMLWISFSYAFYAMTIRIKYREKTRLERLLVKLSAVNKDLDKEAEQFNNTQQDDIHTKNKSETD